MLTLPVMPMSPVHVSGHEVRLLVDLAKTQPARNRSKTLDVIAVCEYSVLLTQGLHRALTQRLLNRVETVQSLRAETRHGHEASHQRIIKEA